ncbi:MAG: hypothetical protein M0R03_08760 [Novosphingobium sp.]|nr:hypothetical protein [Novosphingobium sp.]
MEVRVIKDFPSANIGDIFLVEDGFIEVSQYSVDFLISNEWVEVYKEPTLYEKFNNACSFTTLTKGKMANVLTTIANVHYLKIFDKFCEENGTFPMTTDGIASKMEKLRYMIKKG